MMTIKSPLASPVSNTTHSPLGDSEPFNYVTDVLTDWTVAGGSTITGTGVYTFADDNSGGSNFIQLQKPGTVLGVGQWNFIAEAKADGLDMVVLRTQLYDAAANGISIFSLSGSGVLVSDTNHTTEIVTLSSGWYRVTITFNLTSDVNGWPTIMMSQNGTTGQVDRDNTSSILLRNVRINKV